MQNMEITDSQMMSHPDISGDQQDLQNPWASRLNYIDIGWRSLGGAINTFSSPDNIFIRVNLRENHKIVYMEYQIQPSSASGTRIENFLVKYGITEDRMQWYENPAILSGDKVFLSNYHNYCPIDHFYS